MSVGARAARKRAPWTDTRYNLLYLDSNAEYLILVECASRNTPCHDIVWLVNMVVDGWEADEKRTESMADE